MQLVPEQQPLTGTNYLIKVNNRGTKSGNKVRLRKYDPVLGEHVWFVTKKLPNPTAK